MSARVAAVAAALVALVSSCTAPAVPESAPTPSATAPATPTKGVLELEREQHAAADRILKQRARAVREHDLRAWLAPIDPSNEALVRRERRLFANLSRLPLQVFTLRAAKEWSWPVGFADDGYAATAYLPYVEQRIRLRGFDTEPITGIYSYTFAEVGGRWRIVTGDDVTEHAGQASGTAPWDVAAISVRRTRHALGIFDARTSRVAGRVMAWAEHSVQQVRDAVPFAWPGAVVVYALSDPVLLKQMGTRYLSAAAVAVPIPDNSMWPDHVASTRVVINPRGLPRSERQGRYLLSHEITHIALADTANDTPAWLQEGLADYVATDGAEPERWLPSPSTIVKAAAGVRGMPGSTFFADENADYDYDVSLAACVVIARSYGEHRLWRFLTRLAEAGRGDGDREGHTDQVLRSMFGINERALARKAARFILSRGE